ncbi:MAG: hypothetical protein U5K32_13265 [Bacteroidales bacterium]|nr:hypothetical protein [Bacteroidales bacterium]
MKLKYSDHDFNLINAMRTIILIKKKMAMPVIRYEFTKLKTVYESPVNKRPKRKITGIKKSNPASSIICHIFETKKTGLLLFIVLQLLMLKQY